MERYKGGFTLLETVIGLFIFCSLTLLSFNNIKNYQDIVEERQSLEWFKNTFKSVFNDAYINQHASRFMIENHNKIIFDITGNKKGETKEISRTLPSTLRFSENSKGEYRVSSTGEAPAATITIKSTLTNKTYIYRVQLGWGEITEEKT